MKRVFISSVQKEFERERAAIKRMIESALSKYDSLRDSPDARVAQEAKNAIADLKWTQAAL